ncbi:hypothetical protein CR513_38895, partial [Mucuna pruriens]
MPDTKGQDRGVGASWPPLKIREKKREMRKKTKTQATYVMDEIHRSICGLHSGGRTMASNVLRAATTN